MDTILKMQHITKTFAATTALDDVSFEVYRGEVHALIGENGAGKSTLIKAITGAHAPDCGTIEFDGVTYPSMNPTLSKKLGIQAIYQELNVAPSLSVAENIFMGDKYNDGIFINKKILRQKTEEVLANFDIGLKPDDNVRKLSVAEKQVVEIAKAVAKNAKLLIMDEPTAPLTNDEVEILFGIIDRLKKQGVTIIYISHRLDELFRVADRITVMRDGKVVTVEDVNNITKPQLIKYMVGRDLSDNYPVRNVKCGDVVLEVNNVGGEKVAPVSFTLRKGEVIGFAGLVGAGRTELARLIFGVDKKMSGEIKVDGKTVQINSPNDAVRYGVGYVAEDRKTQGVLLKLPIKWNITLPILRKFTKGGFIIPSKEKECVNKYKDALRIKTSSLSNLVANLSGGNQQKVALSKWLASECKVLILDEPTRGIDVGAKQEIYQLINTLSEQGLGIIVISSEMDEILGMSDRLLVMCEGRVTGLIEKADFSQELVLSYASGETMEGK